MKVHFLSAFEQQLRKSRDKQLAKIVLECISLFEHSGSLEELSNIKKLKGHHTAYRYRKGKYRIGFFYEDGEIIFAALASRDKIYRIFP